MCSLRGPSGICTCNLGQVNAERRTSYESGFMDRDLTQQDRQCTHVNETLKCVRVTIVALRKKQVLYFDILLTVHLNIFILILTNLMH